jgi:hypothetical protein
VKVWDKREFKDLDGDVELGTRNIKLALRRLRKFARTGAPDELDLDGTIRGTAHKGYLDILMRPERHNAVKVLLFFDIGGSMDWHIKATEELFSAARTEFKHMEHFYFHNCLYEKVWKENRRRFQDTTPTWDLMHTYPHDLRDRRDRRLGRALQRGGGRGVDGSRNAHLPGLRMAQPGARARVGLHAVNRYGGPTHGRADVSAHARRARPRDARTGALRPKKTAHASRNVPAGLLWLRQQPPELAVELAPLFSALFVPPLLLLSALFVPVPLLSEFAVLDPAMFELLESEPFADPVVCCLLLSDGLVLSAELPDSEPLAAADPAVPHG